jgi:hypothetical protein
MAIGSAIERGSLICVYDERGTTLFQKASGSGPKDGLLGSLVPPSPSASARSSTVRRTRDDDLRRGRLRAVHLDHPVQHPVRVDTLDRMGGSPSAGSPRTASAVRSASCREPFSLGGVAARPRRTQVRLENKPRRTAAFRRRAEEGFLDSGMNRRCDSSGPSVWTDGQNGRAGNYLREHERFWACLLC